MQRNEPGDRRQERIIKNCCDLFLDLFLPPVSLLIIVINFYDLPEFESVCR